MIQRIHASTHHVLRHVFNQMLQHTMMFKVTSVAMTTFVLQHASA